MNEDIPAPVRTAMMFLRHTDVIRCPPKSGEFASEGRELSPKEQEAEDAALDLMRYYFRGAMPPEL